MSNVRRVFVDTYSRLERAAFSRDRESLISAAGLLRLLLIDGSPLAVRATALFHQKLRLLAPSLSGTPTPPATLSVGAFLATLLPAPESEIAVKDVVLYFAHVGGAVHAGKAKSPGEVVLQQLESNDDELRSEWPLSALKAIGWAVLRSLEDIRARILGANRFEGAVGASVFCAIAIGSMGGDRENVLFDFGAERHRNRLTVFVDADDRLSARLYTDVGERIVLQAPPEVAFEYASPMVLDVRFGFLNNEMLIGIATDPWNSLTVQRLRGASARAADFRQMVMGSDLEGVGRSNFRVWEMLGYDRMQTATDYDQTRSYLAQSQRAKCVVFDGDAFMHSPGHELLGDGSPGALGLAQPNTSRAPRHETT